MSKITLQFETLRELTDFSRQLNTGFLLNTSNLTLSAAIPPEGIHAATQFFRARQVQTTDNVFSYDRHVLSPVW